MRAISADLTEGGRVIACCKAVRGYHVAPHVGSPRCSGTSLEEAAVLGGGARTGVMRSTKSKITHRPGPGFCINGPPSKENLLSDIDDALRRRTCR
eukprot:2916815-Amphidinium_carterae.1